MYKSGKNMLVISFHNFKEMDDIKFAKCVKCKYQADGKIYCRKELAETTKWAVKTLLYQRGYNKPLKFKLVHIKNLREGALAKVILSRQQKQCKVLVHHEFIVLLQVPMEKKKF